MPTCVVISKTSFEHSVNRANARSSAWPPWPTIVEPLPAAMDDRVVPKRSNPYIPGFVRALVQALVPRRTYPCGHSASRARRSGTGRLTD